MPTAGGAGPATVDPVVVGVSVLVTLVVVGLAVAFVVMLRTVARMRREATELAADVATGIERLDAALRRADRQLARVDDLIGSAESLSGAIGSASRLASTAMSTPVIKVMAMGSGAARAGRRLREGPEPAPTRSRSKRRG